MLLCLARPPSSSSSCCERMGRYGIVQCGVWLALLHYGHQSYLVWITRSFADSLISYSFICYWNLFWVSKRKLTKVEQMQHSHRTFLLKWKLNHQRMVKFSFRWGLISISWVSLLQGICNTPEWCATWYTETLHRGHKLLNYLTLYTGSYISMDDLILMKLCKWFYFHSFKSN